MIFSIEILIFCLFVRIYDFINLQLPAESKTSENEDEPPPKRAKRTAAVKAAIALDNDSDEDDDDSGEPLTKVSFFCNFVKIYDLCDDYKKIYNNLCYRIFLL